MTFLYQAPPRERKIKTVQGKGPSRALDRTVAFLADGGVPANPATLRKLRQKLSVEVEPDRRQVLEDIKNDPGLLMHCAKQLRAMGQELGTGLDPLAVLLTLEQEKLAKLVSVQESEISAHRLRRQTGPQARRMQESLHALRMAETLAERSKQSPTLAYSAAFLRQLGLSLIAWNYPQQYARAMQAERASAGKLEEELERVLGISPAEIAARFAAEWQLNPEIRRALESKSAMGLEAEGAQASLRELCEYAEIYARAQNEDAGDEAKANWAKLSHQLEERFGPGLTERVAAKITSGLQQFVRAKPELPPTLGAATHAAIIPSAELNERLRRNAYVNRLSPALREGFAECYRHFTHQEPAIDALRYLVDELAPKAGVRNGCFYLFNSRAEVLTPALRFGALPLASYATVGLNDPGPVAQSIFASAPMVIVDPAGPVYVYAAIDDCIHSGVLGLRYEEQDWEGQSVLWSFKAIHWALIDCLGRRNRA